MGNIITKKTLIWIVAIVIIGWFAMSYFNKPATTETGTTVGKTATTSSTVAKTTTTVKKVVPLASQPVSLSYQKALELYTGNMRIQLSGDSFCQANPNNGTYKNGTSIMIDNRSPLSRTIKLGSTYTIEGYGFKIVKLSSSVLPTTFVMDCGSQQNVGKYSVQK